MDEVRVALREVPDRHLSALGELFARWSGLDAGFPDSVRSFWRELLCVADDERRRRRDVFDEMRRAAGGDEFGEIVG